MVSGKVNSWHEVCRIGNRRGTQTPRRPASHGMVAVVSAAVADGLSATDRRRVDPSATTRRRGGYSFGRAVWRGSPWEARKGRLGLPTAVM